MKKGKVKNEYILKGDFAEMHILGSKQGDKIILVDREDVDRLSQCKWMINKYKKSEKVNYYAVNKDGVLLHRFIMNATEGRKNVVDHINGNTLDNRKSNLQICSQRDNLRKAALKSTNKSGVTGVCWYKKTGKWMAHIKLNYKHITIGYYDTIEEALKARMDYEKKYYGKFAPSRNYNDKLAN